jgi:hypothetical protein
MTDYLQNDWKAQQEIRREANHLADLVSKGRIEPDDKSAYPAQLTEYTQKLMRENSISAQRKLTELKQDLHQLLPSDFPSYSDSQGKIHIVDLSKVEGAVNLMFIAIERKQGNVDDQLLAQLNSDLWQLQKVHKENIPADASAKEIQSLLSRAFAADFNRRKAESQYLKGFKARLNEHGFAEIVRSNE